MSRHLVALLVVPALAGGSVAWPAQIRASGGAAPNSAPTADAALADAGLKQLEAIEAALRRVIEQSRPAVVSIFLLETAVRPQVMIEPFDPRRELAIMTPPSRSMFEPFSYASGIVLDDRGLILTCYHVIEPLIDSAVSGSKNERIVRQASDPAFVAAQRHQIVVRAHDGSNYRAQIFAADPLSDLAVLEIQSGAKPNVRAIEMGDGDRLFRGQFVLAIGNPYGTAAADGGISASMGIVSNTRRKPLASMPMEERHVYRRARNLIQTDARLNLGISGGALINLRGQLVGVIMALAAATGFETPGGFALPTDALTRRVISTLRNGREVEYGFLGITMDRGYAGGVNQDGQEPATGVRVNDTLPLPTTIRSGLRPGDVIVAVAGKPVRDETDLVYHVSTLAAGAQTKLDVTRGQQRVTLDIELTKNPVTGFIIVANDRPVWNGIRVDHISTTVSPYYRFGIDAQSAIRGGVVVRDVEAGSPAAKRDVVKGQIIVRVNDRPVSRPEEFEREVAKTNGPVKLTVHTSVDRPLREITLEAPSAATKPSPVPAPRT
jgi:S1-C subfamily serine protease